jgi:hypothetical protein
VTSTTRPRVAILGSGPAGLVSAWAAKLAEWEPHIYSAASRPSGMFGAQYLHEPIPYVTPGGPVQISYQLRGTAGGYRERVYGPNFAGEVSPEMMESEHDAWDLRATYSILHEQFREQVAFTVVRWADLDPIKNTYDYVVSTVPADKLCPGWKVSAHPDRPGPAHWFQGTEIWTAGEAPELGIKLPYNCPDNTVICNGDSDGPAWYRMSRIFGRLSIEWPGSLPMKPPINSIARVMKPTSTNCDCWVDEKYLRVGRYGEWRKGALVHEAFNKVYQALLERKDAL